MHRGNLNDLLAVGQERSFTRTGFEVRLGHVLEHKWDRRTARVH